MDVDQLSQRLGRYAIGASRDLQALAETAAGETLIAAVVAVWNRRGYVVAATDAGVRLARRPRLFGRARSFRFDWRELTAVDSSAGRVTLSFGSRDVRLTAAPHGELVRLLEAARAQLHGDDKPSVDELRELARRKLGRPLAWGFESLIDGLPDRLEPGERVERLAGATGEFEGLLVLTDRRLLLINVPFRRANERVWAVPRGGIRGAEPAEEGLRLVLADGELMLTDFLPPDRRDEFAAVLGARTNPGH